MKYLQKIAICFSLLMFGLFFSGQAGASEALSITHLVQSYSANEYGATVILSLEVQNNTGENITNVEIAFDPMLKDPISQSVVLPESVSVSGIAPQVSHTITYTLNSTLSQAEGMFSSAPLAWNITYLDSANAENNIKAISHIVVTEGGV